MIRLADIDRIVRCLLFLQFLLIIGQLPEIYSQRVSNSRNLVEGDSHLDTGGSVVCCGNNKCNTLCCIFNANCRQSTKNNLLKVTSDVEVKSRYHKRSINTKRTVKKQN